MLSRITSRQGVIVYSAYLQALLTESDLEVYPMPSDVPYNVDMSLADVQLEEVEP